MSFFHMGLSFPPSITIFIIDLIVEYVTDIHRFNYRLDYRLYYFIIRKNYL